MEIKGCVITKNKKTGKLTRYAAGHSNPAMIDESLVPMPEDEEIYTGPIPEDAEIEIDYMRKIIVSHSEEG